MRTPPPLLAITPGRLAGRGALAREQLLRAVAAAAQGGVRGLLVREPHLEDGPLLDLAQRAGAALRRVHGDDAWLGVHDRVHLARAAGADGAHVGGRSLAPVDARASLGAGLALGRSTHGPDDPANALEGCDFALHAPVFPPNSKDAAPESALGPAAAARFAEQAPVPTHALGGVTAERIAQLCDAGAARAFAGVALIGGLWAPAGDAAGLDRVGAGDLAGIESRARALADACAEVFA